MKAYDESSSKIIAGHKYKDIDRDNDKVREKPNICYIFEMLMTYPNIAFIISFQNMYGYRGL